MMRRVDTTRRNRPLSIDLNGLFAECAAWRYLAPIAWNPCRIVLEKGEPDLGDFIDVKCRLSGSHMCIYPGDDGEGKVNDRFAYVCACSNITTKRQLDRARLEGVTVYFCGWMWGRKILADYQVEDKAHTGRPCFWIPEKDCEAMPALREIHARRGGLPWRVVK
jgi:hypothetical protein